MNNGVFCGPNLIIGVVLTVISIINHFTRSILRAKSSIFGVAATQMGLALLQTYITIGIWSSLATEVAASCVARSMMGVRREDIVLVLVLELLADGWWGRVIDLAREWMADVDEMGVDAPRRDSVYGIE